MTGAVHRWSRSLAHHGVQTSIVCEPPFSDRPDDSENEAVQLHTIRHLGERRLTVPVGLSAHLQDADLLVLHSAWTSQNAVAGRVARRMGVPYLLEPRGAYDPHIVGRHATAKKLWWRAAEGRLVTAAAALHVFFPQERKHVSRIGFDGPVVVAPNGVHNPTPLCWDGGSGDYVLWLGRFDPEHKGLDLLLAALAAIPVARRPRLRLHGPDWRGCRRDVAALVGALGLNRWVEIGAAVYGDEKYELLSRARAFVYPSRWEAFGNSAAEAALLGVPLVTTRYPLGDYLAHRGAAVACDTAPDALADGLQRALGPDAAPLGARAREVAATELAWDVVAERWLAQVQRIL